MNDNRTEQSPNRIESKEMNGNTKFAAQNAFMNFL